MFQRLLTKALDYNGWLLFLLFSLVSWLFVFMHSEFVVTEQLYDEYVDARMEEKYDDYGKISEEFEEDIEDLEEGDDAYWYDPLFDFGIITIQTLFSLV